MDAPPSPRSEPARLTSGSPALTLTEADGKVPQKYSPARQLVLLLLFCLAQFIDLFNNAALFSAIPRLIIDLHMSTAESTWLISAFQLTFASFLLISGRMSDVYNPKIFFIGGIATLGILSIGAGFVKSKIPLIVIRALSGIAGAMTIPSALTLIVNIFPEPREQARAISMFGGCGAVGNTLGVVIGAIFVQFTSWNWVFWFVAIIALPIAAIGAFFIPAQEPKVKKVGDGTEAKWRSLDIVGVTILTIALILFIFAITSGSASGWSSATVLAPLIISVFLVAEFFRHETTIPADRAAIPPRTWFLPNFSVLFATALLPYFWFTTVFTLYTTLWQNVYHWSVISAAIHTLPSGIVALIIATFAGSLSRWISSKYVILVGEGLAMIATILLAFADGPDRYWPYVFPAIILGAGGISLVFTHTNIAIFRTSPASMAGTVGAIFNAALQLGAAVGIAAVGQIESSQDAKKGKPDSYAGRAAAFWFLLAIVGVEWLALLVFYHVDKEGTVEEPQSEDATEQETEKEDVAINEQADTEKKRASVEVASFRRLSVGLDREHEGHTQVTEGPSSAAAER